MLKCKYRGSCDMGPGEESDSRKRHCAACRFNKCLKLGMVKTGTHVLYLVIYSYVLFILYCIIIFRRLEHAC